MAHKRRKSLAFVCTVYTALVIAASMAVYGAYQYLNTPGESAFRLFVEHGAHMLAFGVLIYLSLSLVLYRSVVRPVRMFHVKLYAITRGDLAPVTVESGVAEVQDIGEVVNFLLRQIGRAVPDVPVSELSGSSEELRSMARELDALDDEAKDRLVSIANKVEEVVEVLSRSSLQNPPQPDEGPAQA